MTYWRSCRLVLGRAERHLRDVDLVAEDDEGHVAEAVVAEEAVQLLLGLHEALPVHRVHQEHNRVHLRTSNSRLKIGFPVLGFYGHGIKALPVDHGHQEHDGVHTDPDGLGQIQYVPPDLLLRTVAFELSPWHWWQGAVDTI